jgi:hypothetical protein
LAAIVAAIFATMLAWWNPGLPRLVPSPEQMSDMQPIDLNAAALGIGRHVSGIADPFNGHIDEFRIAHVQRSDGWIETTWNKMSDPGAFATAAAEDRVGGRHKDRLIPASEKACHSTESAPWVMRMPDRRPGSMLPSGRSSASSRTPACSAGLCKATCPESVIRLEPRLNFTDEARQPLLIKEEEPSECIRCGKPFGTRASIERIVEKLGEKHWMYQDPAKLHRIRMCNDCRVIVQIEATDNPLAGPPRPNPRTTQDYLREREEIEAARAKVKAERGNGDAGS